MTREVSFEDTMELLDKAVFDRGPEWVYPSSTVLGDDGASCVYFNDPLTVDSDEVETLEQHGIFQGAPACLVGEVYHRLGIGVESLGELNTAGVNDVDLPGLKFNDQATQLLYMVQSCQDMGIPWGQAVEVAKAMTADDYRDLNQGCTYAADILRRQGWKQEYGTGKWIAP